MANYSAQKLKSVSLNSKEKRYANNEEGAKLMSSTSDSKSLNSKPLINPNSEASSTSSKPITDVNVKSKKFDWLSMFNKTFFSLFLDDENDNVGNGLFDFSFTIGSKKVLVLVHQENLTATSKDVPVKELKKLKQRAASFINKRFQQIKYKHNLIEEIESEAQRCYYIGLTSLSVKLNDESFQIEHDYGSQFFQEDCVLDLDDENSVLQTFSLNNFYQITNLLQTPSDMLSFFDHHIAKLIDYQEFKNEFDLANSFLGSPDFFQRAIDVQNKLVDIGLLSNVESRLIKLTQPDSDDPEEINKLRNELVEKLKSYSTMYQKLLNGATKHRHKAGNIIPKEQVKLLVNESMYTRLSIIEEMVAYENRSQAECLEGYLCHQHSYNDFGNHYVMVVYGIKDDAEYSREVVEENYENMLMDVNAQLQDPAMSEYFILAFDMSNHDGKGNVSVKLDVFHKPGFVMSEIEQQYYEQTQGLA